MNRLDHDLLAIIISSIYISVSKENKKTLDRLIDNFCTAFKPRYPSLNVNRFKAMARGEPLGPDKAYQRRRLARSRRDP